MEVKTYSISSNFSLSCWSCHAPPSTPSFRCISGILKAIPYNTKTFKLQGRGWMRASLQRAWLRIVVWVVACKAKERVLKREGMVFRKKRLAWLWKEMTDWIVEERLARTLREMTGRSRERLRKRLWTFRFLSVHRHNACRKWKRRTWFTSDQLHLISNILDVCSLLPPSWKSIPHC